MGFAPIGLLWKVSENSSHSPSPGLSWRHKSLCFLQTFTVTIQLF